ncbi:MAG: succinyl-CoA synthetase subunit alpha [Candidatus Aenigmarchaeota archaeon]|nr:succinyl-CoA synthetase subunit alpha [Candidatus Aenigmarchaeota archaeon]
MSKNYDYFMKLNVDEYIGLWVAIEEEKVLSSGKDIKEVYRKAKEKCPKKKILLTRVPDKDTMIF